MPSLGRPALATSGNPDWRRRPLLIFGSSPRVREKSLFLTLAPDGELDGRARDHRSDLLGEIVSVLTGCPFTAVMTSPVTMPALAAGLSACGSATSWRPVSSLEAEILAMWR